MKAGPQVTHFLLIEEKYGVSPPFGIIVLGDGSRVQVRNTDELQARVLAIAEQIRERRRVIRRRDSS